MHQKGTYVFYGSGGICLIEDIKTAPLEGMPIDQQYYVLKPVHETGEIMFVPVECKGLYLRRIMTHAEAEELLSSLDSILPFEDTDSKQLRAAYAKSMDTHEAREWVRVIKTVEMRRASMKRGLRPSETERVYLESAWRYLITETSIAMGWEEASAKVELKRALFQKEETFF